MPQIRLSDADRQRLNIPPELEWLPVNPSAVTVRQAMVLRQPAAGGYNTPTLWRMALVREAAEAPTVAGKLAKLAAESDPPLAEQLLTLCEEAHAVESELLDRRGENCLDYQAWIAFAWLALQQNGIPTVLTELDFDIDSFSYRHDPDDPTPDAEEPGKDPSGPPPPPGEPS